MKRALLILALTVFITGLAMAQIAPRSNGVKPANQSKAAVTSQDDGDTITKTLWGTGNVSGVLTFTKP